MAHGKSALMYGSALLGLIVSAGAAQAQDQAADKDRVIRSW
jgi:hypothetical protein